MTTQLGTIEDLPKEYIEKLNEAGVAPLWPMMRNVLPHNLPIPVTKTGFWDYHKIKELLLFIIILDSVIVYSKLHYWRIEMY